MAVSTEIDKLLAHAQLVISYAALRTEVPIDEIVPIPKGSAVYRVPARATLDPETEAAKVTSLADDAVILIPGRRFDATGTRHGQGGGWYDRFLTHVPRPWLRIGFCFSDQFSEDPLPRESWDQEMDYVLVVDRKNGALSLYSCQGEPT